MLWPSRIWDEYLHEFLAILPDFIRYYNVQYVR